MIVNIICSDGISGHEKPVLEMKNHISKDIKYQIYFLTKNHQIERIFEFKKIDFNNINLIKYNNIFDLFIILRKILKSHYKDIIHTHLTKADIICSIYKTILFKNLILISTRPYDYSFNSFNLFFYSFIYRFFSNFNYQICISNNIKSLIHKYEKFDRTKIKIIYYGAEKKIFKSNFRIFNPKKIKISIVGRLINWKNHIQILNHLRDPIFRQFIIKNNIFFTFFGDGPNFSNLQKNIELFRLSKFVAIKQNVQEIDTIYGETDILLHPSLFEGFGLVALEAFSFRIPVICNKSIGMSGHIELISPNMVIDISSIIELRNSIKFTIDNYEYYSNKVYKFFSENMTYGIMSNNYLVD